MEKLLDIQRVILEQFVRQPFYDRELFRSFTFENKINGLVGSRGVGKTTFLLHHVQTCQVNQQPALYVSADNLFFLETRLVDLVDRLYKETDIRLLCIDEIHKYAHWDQELKNIADTYLDFHILFTGSSQIDLVHGKYDLSRRVTLYHLHGLSFREYLEILLNKKQARHSFEEIVQSHYSICQAIDIQGIIKLFHDYLRVGYYPFFRNFTQEREKFQTIENITQKTIYEDIGTLYSLKTTSLNTIESIYKFILNSPAGELSVYKLASDLRKDFESVSCYVQYLEKAGLVRFLYPKKTGRAYLRNPIKLYPENSNLLYAAYLPMNVDNMTGKVRETFVINQLQNTNISVYYSDIGDFQVEDHILEIGGKNKNHRQVAGKKNMLVFSDGIVTGLKQKIPLYLLGFLY